MPITESRLLVRRPALASSPRVTPPEEATAASELRTPPFSSQ